MGLDYRIFLVFLAYGFLIDASSWIFYISGKNQWIIALRHPYTVVELGIFLYIIFRSFPQPINKRILPVLLMILSLTWLWSAPFLALQFYRITVGTFESFWGMVISFSSAFLVLKLIEKEKEPLTSTRIWVVFGMFFYSFSTFFIFGFLQTELGTAIYALHSMINIFTNIIFTVGFYFLYRPQNHI